MSEELRSLSAGELRARAAAGEVSPSEIVAAHLDAIAATDPSIGAFVDVQAEAARARAADLEARRTNGETPGPLYGVPIAIKDNLSFAGWPLHCGSRILEGYRASFTATATARLLAADAIVIGRCNMDEFGFGSSTEHSAFQKTHNPWDLRRIPGGSSGGSAAAVAAHLVPIALGSDTGGSIRQPAAVCGVSGIKPTYGRVSRFGLVAFGSSLDQIGPLTRCASDAALALSVMSGKDPRDATSLDAPFDLAATDRDVTGLRIGLPKQCFHDAIDPAIRARVTEAVRVLEGLGATTHEVDLPHTEHAIAAYYLVATSEASSNLARFDGVRYGNSAQADSLDELYEKTRGDGFGDEAKRRILLGVFSLSSGYYDAHYLQALKVRTLLRGDFERVFEDVDVVLGPTTPSGPFELGETEDDPLQLYLCDVMTTPANLAGIPAMSIPCGLDDDGLPVGMQIQGPVLGDEAILRVANAYQCATSFHRDVPTAVRS